MKTASERIRTFFRQRPIGRTLVLLVCLKLFIMFAILRVFFFKPAMRGMEDKEKAELVSTRLGNTRP